MTTKCLRYDMIMIRPMNDGYIYVVIWYEICYGTRYVINWHVYDMIYCDAICYCMICIWWNVMLKAWDITLCLLNCVYTTWYEWHEITINDMKYNPVRIMYDMRTKERETIWYEYWTIGEMIWKMIQYVQNASWVVLNDNENRKMLGPHTLCVLMHWGIPLFHHKGTDAYIH